MFFATSILHVQLMQWDDGSSVERAINKCDEAWESIDPNRVCQQFLVCHPLNKVFYLV